MKSFFEDKFEYDFRSNEQWIESIAANDEIPAYVAKMMSHILNVHHIWLSRLSGEKPESFTWDELPSMHWQQLNHDNFRRTIEFLEQHDSKGKIHYHSEEGVEFEKSTVDVLYHILNHGTHHRAQISLALRQVNLPVPSLNFIAYH